MVLSIATAVERRVKILSFVFNIKRKEMRHKNIGDIFFILMST